MEFGVGFFKRKLSSKLYFREKRTVTAVRKGVNEFIPTLYIIIG
jgi:hypothetical protein